MPLETQDQQLSMVAILSRRLAGVLPPNDTELAILAHLVGLAYSLRRAAELSPEGYSDQHAHRDFGKRFLSTSKVVTSPAPLFDGPWEAGYYFSSALMRIEAANVMIRNYAGDQVDLSPEDSRNMRRIQREVEEVLAARYVTFDDAATAAWKLASAFLAIQKDLAA